MGCSHEWGELLSKHVDGEAADDEKARLEDHLRGCPDCRDLLAIFQRNENMLDNALTGEAFGSNIVEGVMAELRREEEPTVIAPVVEEPPARTRWFPILLGISAAAAIVLSTVALVMPRGLDDETRRRLDAQGRTNETLAKALRDVRAMADLTSHQFVTQLTDQDREILRLRAGEQVPVGETWAMTNTQRSVFIGIKVRDVSIFKSFDIERTEHGKNEWKSIATGLLQPSYTDASLTPNVYYDYRYIGTFDTGKKDEPMPPVTNVHVAAGEMSGPEQLIDIRFIGNLPNLDQATFRLSRRVGEKDYERTVNVKRGEMIGGHFVFDEKEIDFTTGLVLQALVETDEVTFITVGSSSQSISRVNVRADLKRVGADKAQALFRGSSTWAAAPR